MQSASLKWITPKAESMIVEIARVSSNPAIQPGEDARLLNYLIRNKHWSPFEMASACVEIHTTRDIGRQVLRHRSFSFQEFSQRYANVGILDGVRYREARLQDHKNRQSSLETNNSTLKSVWRELQQSVMREAEEAYDKAINLGIAKEVARAVLPEGLTPTRFYMSGTIRSWLHYLELRTGNGTQLEHRHLAQAIELSLFPHLPTILKALRPEGDAV